MKQNYSSKRYPAVTDYRGFTLVELMITLVISGIIVAAIYSAYIVQQRSHTAQDAVAEMQQNIRAAMIIMGREIRMAGYDPDGLNKAGITVAGTDTITFTLVADDDGLDNDNADLDGDSSTGADEPGELKTIKYNLYDAYGDGDTDIGRQVGTAASTKRAIAENIQAIEFQYLDGTGEVTTTPAYIRAVRISILARASRPDRNFTNNRKYLSASGSTLWDGSIAGQEDQLRRRLLITTIQLRNMGL